MASIEQTNKRRDESKTPPKHIALKTTRQIALPPHAAPHGSSSTSQHRQTPQQQNNNLFKGRKDTKSMRYSRSLNMFFVIFYKEEYNTGKLALKENDFLDLYGKHIFDFVRSGHWKILTLEISCRLGLQKSAGDDDTYDNIPNNNLKVMSIWLSNGIHGEEKGSYYATYSGSNEKIKTDLYALEWNGSTPRQVNVKSDKYSSEVEDLFWMGSQDRIRNIFEIDTFCSQYPGRILLLDQPTSRNPSTRAIKFMDVSKVVPHPDIGDHCLRASLLNALELFASAETALEYIRKERLEAIERMRNSKQLHRYRGIICIGKALGKQLPKLELAHVRDDSGKKIEFGTNFFVHHKVEGVFLMTLRSMCGMQHSVAVDTRCQPGLIYDGAEKHPMKLCAESISLCAGEENVFECIEDVRQVRWKKVSSKEKKPHKKKRKRREEYESRIGKVSK